jgi:hypothetical protein
MQDLLNEFESSPRLFSKRVNVFYLVILFLLVILNVYLITSIIPSENILKILKFDRAAYLKRHVIAICTLQVIALVTSLLFSLIPYRGIPFTSKFIRIFLIISIILFGTLVILIVSNR